MAKWQEVPISEARASLGELATQLYYKGGGVYLTKNGKVVAAIVTVAAAERVRREQEKSIEALNKIHELNIGGDMTQEEWEAFVQSEVEAVRAERTEAQKRTQPEIVEPVR